MINELLDGLEIEARVRANELHALGKLGRRGGTTHGVPLMDILGYDRLTPSEQRELRRLKAAGHAATDVDTFVALCKGHPVPASRLQRRIVNYKHRIDDVRG